MLGERGQRIQKDGQRDPTEPREQWSGQEGKAFTRSSTPSYRPHVSLRSHWVPRTLSVASVADASPSGVKSCLTQSVDPVMQFYNNLVILYNSSFIGFVVVVMSYFSLLEKGIYILAQEYVDADI